jgi:UDP-N-acetylglucosamine 2-epimerase (non-hydrolysing)
MKRKILTILGTRPEIIRLSRIMPKLDSLCDHHVLHTGQNYDANLNDIFFKDLGLRACDHIIDSRGTMAEQMAKIFVGVEAYLNQFQPDSVLILGDTNSGLAAIVCERMGIPVHHMEAGNRCYDLTVPEEKNRKIIDSISTINLPYTELSRQNLLREGVPNNRIMVTGNPILEVITHYQEQINTSTVLQRFGLTANQYIVATAHRAENVDNEIRLRGIMLALDSISQEYPVIFSCHPRTRQRLQNIQHITNSRVQIVEPMGFFDFAHLEQHSYMAISDSGTVQEEMCLFHKPTVTIRMTTERPETVWCGSNIVSGLAPQDIVNSYRAMKVTDRNWDVPVEYAKTRVSDTVVNILMGI